MIVVAVHGIWLNAITGHSRRVSRRLVNGYVRHSGRGIQPVRKLRNHRWVIRVGPGAAAKAPAAAFLFLKKVDRSVAVQVDEGAAAVAGRVAWDHPGNRVRASPNLPSVEQRGGRAPGLARVVEDLASALIGEAGDPARAVEVVPDEIDEPVAIDVSEGIAEVLRISLLPRNYRSARRPLMRSDRSARMDPPPPG